MYYVFPYIYHGIFEIYIIIYIFPYTHIHIYIENISHIYICRKQNISEGENWKCASRLTTQRNPVPPTYYLHSGMLTRIFPFHPFGTAVNFAQLISIFHKQCDYNAGSRSAIQIPRVAQTRLGSATKLHTEGEPAAAPSSIGTHPDTASNGNNRARNPRICGLQYPARIYYFQAWNLRFIL